jgi:hypothetical protein
VSDDGQAIAGRIGLDGDPLQRACVDPERNPDGWAAHVPPWCLKQRPLRIEPNVPFRWPVPWRTFRGGPIDPLEGE